MNKKTESDNEEDEGVDENILQYSSRPIEEGSKSFEQEIDSVKEERVVEKVKHDSTLESFKFVEQETETSITKGEIYEKIVQVSPVPSLLVDGEVKIGDITEEEKSDVQVQDSTMPIISSVAVDQESKIEIIRDEKRSDKKIQQDSTLTSERDLISVGQEVKSEDTIEVKSTGKEIVEDSIVTSVRGSLSIGREIEIGDTIEEKISDEQIADDSLLATVISSVPIGQEIKIGDTVEEIRSDEEILQDYSLTSGVGLKATEQEMYLHKTENVGLETTMEDSTLRSARGSTPLPQILEELMKKGRIALRVPENKRSNESLNVSKEKDLSFKIDTKNIPISSTPEVVNLGDTVDEKVLVSEHEIIEDDKSVTHLDESKKVTVSEIDVSKKDEPLPITANNSSYKQVFVFGNQANRSDSAINRNLTFEIGSSQFDNTVLEDPLIQPQESPSSRLDYPTRDSDETEPRKEVDTPRIPNVSFTQTCPEVLIHSTSEEMTAQSYTQEPHSVTLEELYGDKPSEEMLIGNVETANAADATNVYSSDLPEDDQNLKVFEFFIDTAGSTCTKQLEADSTADFELKMSEGESVTEVLSYESNEVIAAEEMGPQEEPVFETLKPLEYQNEEVRAIEEDDYHDQLSEKKENDDEDIYGDLEEKESEEEDEEDESADRESENEQEGKEVICLGSSSDEDPPTNKHQSSTPYSHQRTPKAIKQLKDLSETLDYEVEEDDQEEEENEEYGEEKEHENESYSSDLYSDDDNEQSDTEEGDSKIEKKNLYFSSESDSDTGHRRSWKEQRKQYDSNESLTKESSNVTTTDEDTVESPPFELIGQDSQGDDKENLETIVEETEDSQKVCETTTFKSTPNEDNSAEKTEREQESFSKTDQFPTEKESNLLGVGIPESGKEDVDIIKLAEENRRKRLETGSILDLKKRRSKRYSSTTDLSESKKAKLRRRSSSLHDFMSAFIKETKSIPQSPEKETLNANDTSSFNVSQISSSDLPTNERFHSPNKNRRKLETQPSIPSEVEFSETGSVTSSLMPEIGSVISTQASACDFPISTVPKPLENLKRRGKSFASRLSSLHDISEEIPDNSENVRYPPQDPSVNKSLRRSVSTDQITVSTQVDNSRTRRSSSVCRWSEYAKAHESEITSDANDIRSSLGDADKPDIHSKSIFPKEFPKVKYVRSLAGSYSNSKISNEEGKCGESNAQRQEIQPDNTSVIEHKLDEEHSNYIESSKFGDIAYQSTDISNRLQRAQSEPSSLSRASAGSKLSRRSSSSMKINKYHKLFLRRSSVRGSFEPQEFEIIDSDAESPKGTSSVGDKMEKELTQESVTKGNESKTPENNFANEQIGVSAEIHEPVEAHKVSSIIEDNKRMKRGHSEPPVVESDFPKTRSRTRSSSFSHKIDKLHKLILPRHIRKSRASVIQPLEVVQSDEEMSFKKTPDQDMESDLEQQVDKEILETPVTSKKRGRPKKLQNQAIKAITPVTEKPKMKEISPPTQEDSQVGNKTTQDYPQPPKKRKRQKSKTEEVISHNVATEIETERHKDGATEPKELSAVEDNKNVTKSKGKKQSGKNLKSNKQIIKRKESESNSGEEALDKVEPENTQTTNESVSANKRGKKKKVPSKGNVDQSDATTPKKTLKTKTEGVDTPPNEESEAENVESSLTESQTDEVTKTTNKEQLVKTSSKELLLLDSPARRTRRSMSRVSDTEMLTPTKEKPQRRTRRSSVMSDVVLSTPNKYAESEASDASTEINVRLMTPNRRSTRRPSISATPNTPDLIPEEFLKQRRLTRHQHSQLQKSFDLSTAESPKLPRLEEVPEEISEKEEVSLTPRSSKRNKATVSKTPRSKSSKK